MGKRLYDEAIARCERDSFLFPASARRLRLLVLVACLIVAGCADRDNASDNDQHGTFYGGVLGGLSR